MLPNSPPSPSLAPSLSFPPSLTHSLPRSYFYSSFSDESCSRSVRSLRSNAASIRSSFNQTGHTTSTVSQSVRCRRFLGCGSWVCVRVSDCVCPGLSVCVSVCKNGCVCVCVCQLVCFVCCVIFVMVSIMSGNETVCPSLHLNTSFHHISL